MADRYIDYAEVSEYGRYFVAEAVRLVGASPLVDMEALRQLVLAAVVAVEVVRGTALVQHSSARGGRSGTAEAADELRGELRRFHYLLKTLPPGVEIDRDAFFPGGKMGKLDRLKPADLLARGTQVVSGFDAPANAALPDAPAWRARLASARDALSSALENKRSTRSQTTDAVTTLSAARDNFLLVYNVAKRLVHAVLALTGRLDEYSRFFLDLQVNENGPRALPEASTEASNEASNDDAAAV